MKDVKLYESEAVSQTETWSSESLELSWIVHLLCEKNNRMVHTTPCFCQITKDVSVEMWFKME